MFLCLWYSLFSSQKNTGMIPELSVTSKKKRNMKEDLRYNFFFLKKNIKMIEINPSRRTKNKKK